MASASHLIITKLSSWTILSLFKFKLFWGHPKFLSNEICLILCNLLVERLFFLNFIVDNGKVVRAVHKVGQVQGVVPVLGGDKVDRKTKR